MLTDATQAGSADRFTVTLDTPQTLTFTTTVDFSNDVDSGCEIELLDDADGGFVDSLEIDLEPGTYTLLVEPYFSASAGDYTLTITN